MKKFWTEEKIKYLKENVDNCTNKELSTFFGVSEKAINMILFRQNINRSDEKRWTKEKIDYLKKNVDKFSNK
jgi:hypothetical protein